MPNLEDLYIAIPDIDYIATEMDIQECREDAVDMINFWFSSEKDRLGVSDVLIKDTLSAAPTSVRVWLHMVMLRMSYELHMGSKLRQRLEMLKIQLHQVQLYLWICVSVVCRRAWGCGPGVAGHEPEDQDHTCRSAGRTEMDGRNQDG
jgi:hypothetical protein